MADRSQQALWAVGEQILGEYVIEKELGRGGMGRVWLVKSNSTGRRFAVKQALIRDDKHRKAFLTELQTWIDLPEHPNIVPCRFFRTVGDDVLIFSEFVDGGSLKNWIDSRRLYDGDQRQSLKRILDTAIQFAWGLHSIHELGLVHQDVKPGNVLMSSGAEAALQGMRVQVSDYGLARARARSGAQGVQAAGEGSILLSSGGYTPAYCSPEQAKGLPITRKTDLWSWGVSVLEMFTGGVTWHSGHLAGAVLDQYVEDTDESSGIPVMPSKLVYILKGCFQNDPAKRWVNLGEVVGRLKAAYLNITGEVYDRELVQIIHRDAPQVGLAERRTANGAVWTDPRLWLEKGLCLSGRSPEEAKGILERRGHSRRGSLVLELAIYEEAKGIYLDLVKKGRADLEQASAILCRHKCFVHDAADDASGALRECDESINILQHLSRKECQREQRGELAESLMVKAIMLYRANRFAECIDLYDQCIVIRKQMVEQNDQEDVQNDLAMAIMNKASAIDRLGDLAGAMKQYRECVSILKRLMNGMQVSEKQGLCMRVVTNAAGALMNLADALYRAGSPSEAAAMHDQSVTLWSRVVNVHGYSEEARHYAIALCNYAKLLLGTGNPLGAVEVCDQSIDLLRRIVEKEGRSELSNDLADVYLAKAEALAGIGDLAGALELEDKGVAILRWLVEQHGRHELAEHLARILRNRADRLDNQGEVVSAIELYDQAIDIYRQLVEQDCRRDLANDLANALMNKATSLDTLAEPAGALALYDQAIAIHRRLVEQDGRLELRSDLARALMNKAIALQVLGEFANATAMYDECITIFRCLVEREGRKELAADLARAIMNKANALSHEGDWCAAKDLYDSCIAIRKMLFEQEGRSECAFALVNSLLGKANALINMRDWAGSVDTYDQCIALQRRLVEHENKGDVSSEMGIALMNKACALANLGDLVNAVKVFDECIGIYRRLVEKEGRREHANDLASALSNRESVVNALRETGFV